MMVSSAAYTMLLVLCTVCGQATSQNNQSDLVFDFMSGFNGNLDNRAQISNQSYHDYIQARFMPIEVKEFGTVPQLYVEVSVNGKVVAMYVAVVTEQDDTEDTIILTPYNFTDVRKHRPGDFNPEALKDLNLGNIHTDPQCQIIFLSLGNGTFTGLWPDCKYIIKERHPAFTVTFSCTGYILTVPLSVEETPSTVPYIFQRLSARYPLINPPNGYVGPCGKYG